MPHPEHAVEDLCGPGTDGLGFFTSVRLRASRSLGAERRLQPSSRRALSAGPPPGRLSVADDLGGAWSPEPTLRW